MHFNQQKARVARVVSLGAATLGAATAVAAQTHPAAAAGIFAAINSAITCATTAACVSGTNTASGLGVEGTSNAGYGVFGLSKGSGTAVFGGAQSGFGMYGYSNRNDGVEGVSTNLNGVEGLSFATNTANAVGVKGSTSTGNGTGVWGLASSSGIGVEGSSNHFPFLATDNFGDIVFDVDGFGDIYHAGSINSASRAVDGTTVIAYSAKSSAPTVEDTGTAQLVGGSSTVLLDPIFARTIDSASSYRVFLTANGDTHGLFVARKTAVGFVVHENEGGRSTVSFDYRIVATALGHAGQRMAVTKPDAVTRLLSAQRPSTPLSKPAPLPRLPGYQTQP